MLPHRSSLVRRASPAEGDTLFSDLLSTTSFIVEKDRRRRALPEVDARDIVQMACVRFLGRVANVAIKSQQHGHALLRLTVSSVISDLLRMKHHTRGRLQLGGLTEVLAQEQFSGRGLRFLGTSSGNSDAIARAISRETVHELAAALRQLSEKDRRAFLRAVVKGESFAAISDRYGLNERTTRRHFAAAKERLMVLLSEPRVIPKPDSTC